MRHFTYRTLIELRQSADRIAPEVRFEDDPQRVREALARPVQVGRFRVGNSIAIHPMEGCDGTLDGCPGELTFRRYRRFAQGGAKLIWFEATAVREDGRANPRQLMITRDNVGDFARLLETARGDDVLIPMQLTHSGRYSFKKRMVACRYPAIGPETDAISDDELERLEDDYVTTAGLAAQAGFEAVDIKMTHGYLLNELLGARHRPGRYGGALENRIRFAVNVIGKIRARYRLLIAVRLGCFDGLPFGKAYDMPYAYGFGIDPADPSREDLTEVRRSVAALKAAGVELLNVSLGCPYFNPHIGRPFEKPDEGNYEQPEHPLVGVARHFRIAGQLQREFPDLPMVGTGYSWLQKYSINAGARNILDGSIRFMGLGRGALAYPDFARAALECGEIEERRVCKTLTFCTYLMRQKHHPLGQFPTGCPPFDKEVYGKVIKDARLPLLHSK